MSTVPLPPGVNRIEVNKYIISYVWAATRFRSLDTIFRAVLVDRALDQFTNVTS